MTNIVEYHDEITYPQFLAHIQNPSPHPLLIGPSLTSSWKAFTWVLPDGQPDFKALRDYEDCRVQVADCKKREYNEFERRERRLGDVLDEWEKELEMTGGAMKEDGDEVQNNVSESSGWYVKDWHQVLEIENKGGKQDQVYTTPDIFQDDWLTSHSLSLPPPHHSDYRFTYLGPSQTSTPLHIDVYGSYSWSTNISGWKRWWFVPRGKVWMFRKGRDGEGELVSDVRDAGEEAMKHVIIVDQEPGQTIFVPSGWYHQVQNLTFTLSINQNFLSSVNLPLVYESLSRSYMRVEESILDVKDLLRKRFGDMPADIGLLEEDHFPPEEVDGYDYEDEYKEDQEEPRGENDQSQQSLGEILGLKQWQVEWVEEVEKLCVMDAGWGWDGFWRMVVWNLKNPSAPPHLRPSNEYIKTQIKPLIQDYKKRKEWHILKEVKSVVREIERSLGK